MVWFQRGLQFLEYAVVDQDRAEERGLGLYVGRKGANLGWFAGQDCFAG